MAPPASSIPARLLSALQSIHASTPRLITSPPAMAGGNPNASRRASVAIIIRLRPSHPAPLSSPSTPPSPPLSTFTSNASQVPSPPASPPSAFSIPNTATPTKASATSAVPSSTRSVKEQLDDFFEQPWVKTGSTAEILFIKRASRGTDRWSGHIAFPGGRQEPEDEDSRYTAMRETWEEVGLDLAEKEWLPVGQLDDREITTSLGKRLLMILSPHVFLCTSPTTPLPELQETEVASAHWIPIELLHAPQAQHGQVAIDISTRLAPKNAFARFFLRQLVGKMHFRCVLLPNEPVAIGQVTPPPARGETNPLRLWGLTLGMSLDLLQKMADSSSLSSSAKPGPSTSTYPHAMPALDSPSLFLPGTMSPLAPSMTSIFPTFSFPDINFLIWVFGWRYRRMMASSRPERDARVNWAGMSLGLYYAAVRRALLVACIMRGCFAAGGLGWFGWWLVQRRKQKALKLA